MSGKAGYVYKEGAKFLTWKKRYLVIERDRLSYYTKDSMKSKKGEILVRTIKEATQVSQYKGRRFVMGIVTTTGRTYYIQGSDKDNVQGWINAINEVIGHHPSATQSRAQSNTPPPRESVEIAVESMFEQDMLVSNPKPTPEPEPMPETPEEPRKLGVVDFEQMKVIGRGGFGRVLLVRKKDNQQVYAMKILKKAVIAAKGEIEHTRTEKSVLSKLNHPFLARLHWSFQDAANLYIVMDFVNGGELFHHLSRENRFGEERTKFYAAQITTGMGYLHANGVIYRDLKPENLLLSAAGNIVMTDFGLSKEGLHANDARTATFCGTPEYLAPEIIRGDEYTKSIDWWSVGTLIYEMLTGLPPFYTEDEDNMYHKIMTADLLIPSFFSPEVGDIIRQFLERDPAARLQEEDQIRLHPWFADIDWVKLLNLELPPPFVPDVRSAEDVGNIDEEFLEEDLNQNDDDEPTAEVATDAFQGFTFHS